MTRKEAINKVKEALGILIPEFAESEDDRVIKSMIRLVKAFYDCNFPTPEGFERKDLLAWLGKQKDASKAIEAVERIDKYIDEHVANAHDMKDSNPDKKYYRGWDDALAKMSGILQDVYLGEKQKEQKELPLMNGDADLYFDNWNQQKQNPTKRQCFEEGMKYAQRLQKEPTEELSIRLNGLMQEYVKSGKDEEDQEHRLKCYQLFWDALGDSEFFKQKKQKPILEVFGFKVGDAVRLKDGDGRKHIIKSFEEVEGLHGPNFYHVEFEDDSARDSIYPGEEYPNGYYTQMEKFEEEQKPFNVCEQCPYYKDCPDYNEQKPIEYADDIVKEAEEYTSKVACGEYGVEVTEAYIAGVLSERNRGTEWSENDEAQLNDIEKAISNYYDLNHAPQYHYWLEEKLKSLRSQLKQEWSEEDKLHYANVLEALEYVKGCKSDYDKIEAVKSDIVWFKSLRPPLKDKEMKLKILKYLSTRCSSLEFEEVENYLNNLRPS